MARQTITENGQPEKPCARWHGLALVPAVATASPLPEPSAKRGELAASPEVTAKRRMSEDRANSSRVVEDTDPFGHPHAFGTAILGDFSDPGMLVPIPCDTSPFDRWRRAYLVFRAHEHLWDPRLDPAVLTEPIYAQMVHARNSAFHSCVKGVTWLGLGIYAAMFAGCGTFVLAGAIRGGYRCARHLHSGGNLFQDWHAIHELYQWTAPTMKRAHQLAYPRGIAKDLGTAAILSTGYSAVGGAMTCIFTKAALSTAHEATCCTPQLRKSFAVWQEWRARPHQLHGESNTQTASARHHLQTLVSTAPSLL